jgi:hypothetical protein
MSELLREYQAPYPTTILDTSATGRRRKYIEDLRGMAPAGLRRALRACALALDRAWARAKDETAKPRRGVRERVRTVESEVVLKALTAARFIWTTAGELRASLAED